MKKLIELLKRFWKFLKWHNPLSLAKYESIREYFNLTEDEFEMIKRCSELKLLKEYLVFSDDESTAWLVPRVCEVRRIIRLRRRQFGRM